MRDLAIERGVEWSGQRAAFWLFVFTLPFTVFWPLTAPLAEGVLGLYVTPGVYITDLAALLLILSVLRSRRSSRAGLRSLLPAGLGIGWSLAGLALLGSLSIIQARSVPLAAYTTLRWLLSLGLWVALASIDLPMEEKAKALVLSAGLQAAVGIGQTLAGGPLGLPGELALGLGEANAAVVYAGSHPFLRAYGLTFHPNVLGGFIAAGLVLCLPLLKKTGWRLAWGLLWLGLLASFSRSAWMAAGIALPVALIGLWLRFPGYRRSLLVCAGSLLALLVVAGIALREPLLVRLRPLLSLAEFTSIQGRGELIALAVGLIREHPFLGIGAGNFPLAQLGAATLDQPHYVHNVALLLASEVGVLGGLVWYWLWLRPVLALQNAWKRATPWLELSILAWAGMGVIALWDFYPWALESGRGLSIFLLALLFQPHQNDRGDKAQT